ncbi:MAG: alkaline phosphatase family protein [Clostridiales bacterium]|nr:alkaline phosphatase family protein [Clostridiales bacterium]
MFLKQTIAIILAFFELLGGLVSSDRADDTEERYRSVVSSVEEYGNTIETALPQTVIHDIITDHFNSPLPEGKKVKKVLVIGYDGARADALKFRSGDGAVDMLLADGGSLNIGYCGGVNYPEQNIQATSTAPGWCSMLTGVWADVHGITGNDMPKSNDHLTILTTLVEDKTIGSSAFYVSWAGHFVQEKSTYKPEKEYCEDKGLDVTFGYSVGDTGTFNKVKRDVSKADCTDFIFSILEYPDHSGHSKGFSTETPTYRFAFKKCDLKAAMLINKVKARKTYDSEDWLFILTSDHGGFGTGHGGPTIQERMTFIATNKNIDAFVR